MSETNEKKLLVFISHASEDNSAAKRLTKRLKDDGFAPWLDLERLLPGQDWIQTCYADSGREARRHDLCNPGTTG